jgi:hypothetical protein
MLTPSSDVNISQKRGGLKMLDRLDRRLLKAIRANEKVRMIDIIRPFLSEISYRGIGKRLAILSKENYVVLEKQNKNVMVALTEAGKKEASGVV